MAPFTLLLTFLPKANTGLNLYWLEKGLTCLTPFQSNFRVKGRYEISLEQKNYKQRDDFPEAGRWRKEASRAKVKAFQKPCLDVAFLSFFFVRARAASIKNVSLKIFFWVGDMTLVLLETTFNPTLNTQFMAGNYIRVIGCLFYSFGAFYGQPFVKHVTTREAFELFVYRK